MNVGWKIVRNPLTLLTKIILESWMNEREIFDEDGKNISKWGK